MAERDEGRGRVAVVRNPSQAVPLSGTWDGAAGDYIGMEVEVDLQARPVPALKVA